MRYSALALALISLNLQYAWADEPVSNLKKDSVYMLPEINVYAEQVDEVGQTKYNQEKLKQTANSNKTISDFLRINPSVQFAQDSLSAGEQGELKAKDISINGALPYENKIVLDNVSLTNMLNPAGGSNEFGMTGMAGSSIATTVNTDLICELEVLDSNVSAEHGDFTGGVIQAKTCAPKTKIGELHGNVSYDYTSSAWTKFNYVDEEERLLFEDNDTKSYQKDFVKQGLATNLYGRLSENFGFNLSAAKRWSDIDYTSRLVNTAQTANQTRANDNFLLNTYWKLNEQHQLKLGMQYQNDQADLNQVHVKNSHKEIDETNTALEAELSSKFAWGKLTQSLVYQEQDKTNDSLSSEMIIWNSSANKNWVASGNANEGGYGDQEQALDSLAYKMKAEINPFQFAQTEHRVSLGAGYGHYEANWARLNDASQYFKPSAAGIDSCLTSSGKIDYYCEAESGEDKGQYHVRRYLLQEGIIDVAQDRGHVFIEDKMNWKNTVKANLGLRVDYDSLTKETNFAPRTTLQYLPYADERLTFTTGWNRYFAQNAFSYKLQDGINQLGLNQTRKTINDEWTTTGYAINTNKQRTQLDVPYTDESMFAISSRFSDLDATLKYVHRDNKDQITLKRIGTAPLTYEYDNIGQSKADVYTLTLSNHSPLVLGTSQHKLSLGVDYTEVVRNFTSYETTYIAENFDEYVVYDGKVIQQINRPADNFARPWTARLAIDSQFTHLPLKISQLFRYRSNYDAMVSSSIPKDDRFEHNGHIVDTQYKPTRIGSAVNWDIRSTYDVKVGKDQFMTLGLTVNNVLNKHNKYTESGEAKLKSESGRQFIADISFKF